MVCIEEDEFGICQDPISHQPMKIRRFTLTNRNKLSISIITRGATVTGIKFPDKNGEVADIVLGFDDVQGYMAYANAYMGCMIGRVANRISNAKFQIGCKDIVLTKNLDKKHQINGGFTGFDTVIWEVRGVTEHGIELYHCSPDNHEGYPGQLTTTVKFTLNESNCFRITIEADTTAETPVNICNNIYFNLAGHETGKDSLYEHSVQINADKVVDVDNNQIPTGLLMPVKNTPYDLREMSNMGRCIKKFKNCKIKGLDCHFCVDVLPGRLEAMAKVVHPASGRWVEIQSNQPAVAFYTGNNLPDMETAEFPMIGKSGAIYEQHGAFSFQSQKYPDAVNQKSFPNIMLKPDEKYFHEVMYKFGSCKWGSLHQSKETKLFSDWTKL